MNSRTAITQIRHPAPAPNQAPGPPVAPGGPPKKEKKKSRGFIGWFFFAAAAGLFYFAWKGNLSRNQGSTNQSSKRDLGKIDSMVNKHLLMTNKKIEIEQERARLINNPGVPSIGEQILPRSKPYQVRGVDHSADRNEANAVRDLEKPRDLNLASPDTVIQSELADTETLTAQDLQSRKEYARQFLENARAGGYAVELDENYVVRSVKKIEPSHRMHLFDSRGGASR